MADTSISQEQARRDYDKLTGRSWKADSHRGTYRALETLIGNEFSRRIHRQVRRGKKARTRLDPKIPAWAPTAFEDFKLGVAFFRQLFEVGIVLGGVPTSPPISLAGALLPGPLHELVAELLVNGRVPVVPDASAPDRDAEAAHVRRIEARWQTLTAREHDELHAFFCGTRIEFHALGYGEPTAKVLALLCAARGIEPMGDGLTRARKRWDQRLERWRREMDAKEPAWRSQAKAWGALGVAA